jgi:adenosine deaminase
MVGMDLRALPKVDLHRHIEGALRLQTIIDLYAEAGDPLPERTPEELAPRAQVLEPLNSLKDALDVLDLVQGAFHSYEAVERIAYEAVEDLALDHVWLAELRFSPAFFFGPAGLDWDVAMDSLLAGVTRASEELDVVVGLIAIFSRDLGPESGTRTVDFTLRHRDDLVGLDIAGDELAYPPMLYRDLLAPLHAAGVPVTAHYGESGPAEYARDAITELRVRRLGHGVSVGSDPEVIALVRDLGVTLEMCPTSNLRTHAVPSLREHPARRLLRANVKVTLNSDDPGLFGIDLTHELEVARRELGFLDGEIGVATQNAIEASFLPEVLKEDVRRRRYDWLSAGV